MTRTPLSGLKGQRSRSLGCFTHRRVKVSGSCSSQHGNVLTVGTYCYVEIGSAALGTSSPTEGGEGRGHIVSPRAQLVSYSAATAMAVVYVPCCCELWRWRSFLVIVLYHCCTGGCVVECRTCNREAAGLNLGRAIFYEGLLSLSSLRGRQMSTSCGWEGKGRYGSFRLRNAGCAGKTVVIPWQCMLYLSALEKFRVEAVYNRHYLYLYCLVVVMFQSSDLPEDLKYWKHADREGDSLLLFSFAQFSLGLN